MQVKMNSNYESARGVQLSAIITFDCENCLDDADNSVIRSYFKRVTDRFIIETKNGQDYVIKLDFAYNATVYDINMAVQSLDEYLFELAI